MIQKSSCSVSTKVNKYFYGMVKIHVIIIQNVNIFTIYETQFQSVINISLMIYQNKIKMPGKNRK